MRPRIALVLTVLASVVWVLALPLWVARYAAFDPNFYRAWLRQSDVVTQWKSELATALPRHISEALWIPWLPRSPDALLAFLDSILPTSETEVVLTEAGPWLAAWAIGESSFVPRIAPEITAPLHSPQGENARALLWESMPACDVAAPPACLPLDSGAHLSVDEAQRAWWHAFLDDLTAALDAVETQMTASWNGPPAWFRWMWYAPLLAAALAVVAALVMPSGRKRWACVSIPLLTGGVIVGGVGVLAMLAMIPPPVVRSASATPFATAALAIFPRVWYALLGILGPTVALAATVSLALGLSFILLIFEGWASKGVAVVSVLLVLLGMMPTYPRSVFAGVASLPASTFAPTPTPWPTSTSTPTLTPTPYYWPVLPGTPVPTPSGSFAADAQLLGCVQAEEAPILSLAVIGQDVSVLQDQTATHFGLLKLARIDQIANVVPPTVYALSPSGQQIALASERDLYVYNFPSWTRALRSRVSTFSRIQTLAYVAGEEQLVLGLENGYLWVIRPATGGLAWLLPAHNSAVVALAAHPTRPWVLSAAADGVLRWWDMSTGEALGTLDGGDAAVEFVAFAPQNDHAVTVDVHGEWTLWDLSAQRVVRRRVLLPDDTLTTLAWTPEFILGGTQNGDLVFVDETLVSMVLPVSEHALTALAVTEAGYALVGTEMGEVCVWGTLDLR